jgi:hypothetical protein
MTSSLTTTRSAGWRRAFFAVLTLWVATILWVAYDLLDRGVTHTYGEVEREEAIASVALLGRTFIAARPESSPRDIAVLLRLAQPDAFIVETDSVVSAGALRFRFRDGRLHSVAGQ